MKKTFAVLMLAAMLFSAGCGNTMDGAKKDAQDAAAKVEQKANEAKDAATAKVDEAKDAATQAADAAKDTANQAADTAKETADAAKDAAATAINEAADAVNGRVVALGGLMPGSTSLDDVKAMFGEATEVNGKVMTFVDGLKVTVDDANKVKTITTTSPSFDSGDGVYVGDADYALNEYCGPADAIRQVSDGVEYEYNSGDRKSVVIYKATNGIISEITCSLK